MTVAIAIVTGAAACTNGDGGGGDTTTTAVDPLTSLRLDHFWDLQTLGCMAGIETDVPQIVEVAAMVKVCQRTPTVMRMLNTSSTSVRLTYQPAWATVTYQGPHAKDGVATTAVLRQMKALAVIDTGLLVLPSGDSAIVTLKNTSGMPFVKSDEQHGAQAFYGRAIGNLIDKLPWDKVGDIGGVTAKATACAGGALAIANQLDLDMKAAIDNAKACYDLSEEISRRWNERRSAAPEVPRLRSGISAAADEGSQIANAVRRFVTRAGQVTHRA
ncbi:hypothetical protein Lesp02_06540 [Lentzea sp. NBRC 105346]|uniref:hypothetical protein n=1 Tax=Lentzea sp. NBRC 105346 TaxID=3032205 RepID=UPI0024A5217C|nr:hypothetical protein [Lentzea sp. NBRC 105346]GLZ28464.1 hypothetical protein Lesp02_06540 [Lentzea sp. NBRC 105346]